MKPKPDVIKLTFKLDAFLRRLSSEVPTDKIPRTLLLETIAALNATAGAIYIYEKDQLETFGSLHKMPLRKSFQSWIRKFDGTPRQLIYDKPNFIAAPLWRRGYISGILSIKEKQSERSFGQKSRRAPFTPEDKAFLIALADSASMVLEKAGLEEESRHIKFTDSPKGIIGSSPEMKLLFTQIETICSHDLKASILIRGESGTGKELIAKTIHEKSARHNAPSSRPAEGGRTSGQVPFIAVNCAAIPKTLIESELFGYKKGAFTGAAEDRMGKFEMANNGTLFLDEVGDMDLNMQSKLLRVLQDGTFNRIGEHKPRQTRFRLISATHKDLKEGIKEEWFRDDLYYRLKTIELVIPPLRNRLEDIPLLAQFFVSKLNQENNFIKIKSITPKALYALRQYHWPGNVRELEQMITHAYIFSSSDTVDVSHLPLEINPSQFIADRNALQFSDILPLESAMGQYVQYVYKKTGEHKAKTMNALGITFRRLRRYLNK